MGRHGGGVQASLPLIQALNNLHQQGGKRPRNDPRPLRPNFHNNQLISDKSLTSFLFPLINNQTAAS
jgi:hypothetical protein